MAVFRVHKTENYTVMSNVHLRDERLSLKAKGLLSLMLSLPDDWNYSVAGLASMCREGETSVRSGIGELERFGYVLVTKSLPSAGSGRITYEYDIYEEPDERGPVADAVREPPVRAVDHTPYDEVISYLNEATGSSYRPTTKEYRRLIHARFAEGYTLDDFRVVIDGKVAEWGGDPRVSRYLHPSTLFAPSHFDVYLNQGRNRRRDEGRFTEYD